MCCGCFSIHNFTLIGTIIRNQAIHLQAEFTCLVNQPIPVGGGTPDVQACP